MPRSFILRLLVSLEYLLIALTGFFLLFFNVINEDYKITVLTLTFAVSFVPVSFRVYTKEWDGKSLGFRLDNLKETASIYLFATFLGLVVLVIYSLVFKTHSSINQTTLIYYSIWGAIAQELLYRAYLYKLGQDLLGENSWLNDTLNVVVFVGMHALYPGFLEKLWILIPAGFLFTFLWKKYPNIIWICLTHIILNATAVSLGVFH